MATEDGDSYLKTVNDLYWGCSGQTISCDSPIENSFLCSYVELLKRKWGQPPWISPRTLAPWDALPELVNWTPLHLTSLDMFIPQCPVGSFRADFVFGRYALEAVHGAVFLHKLPLIVVECDGHDYHERTKEQAAHDRSRDRSMTINRFRVLRFTGSEIHKNADRCAEQVDQLFGQLLGEITARRTG